MGLVEDLRRIVDGLPSGAAVSLPVDWLAVRLGEQRVEDEVAALPTPADDLTVEAITHMEERSPSTVRRWMAKIPGAYIHPGSGEWRVSRENYVAWRASQAAPRTEPEPPAPARSPARKRRGDGSILGAARTRLQSAARGVKR